MTRRAGKEKRELRLLLALILALCIHGAVLGLLSLYTRSEPTEEKKAQERQIVVSLAKPAPKMDHPSVTPSKESLNPPDTKFVSTKNSNPDKESVNRTSKKRTVARKPRKKSTPRPVKKQVKPPRKEVSPPKKELPRLKPGEIAVRPTPSTKSAPRAVAKKKKQGLTLFPSAKEVDKILGVSSSDYVPGVQSGKKTVLKTKKWVGASFFLRVKEAVSQVWDPGTVYKRHDPDGSYYGFKNWFTVLKITLDAQGRIKRIYFAKNSGLSFLDKEAMRAFKVAGPFPNPPKEILDPRTGLVTFNFGFLVEVNRNLDFKLFRF